VDYQPIARLGRGGMGVVDLARDPKGNRVAMKRLTLHGSASDIQRARQRLLREGDVLRRLHHPNIVRLLDIVEDGDEIVLVMPYLNGGNLAERVAQHGPAPAEEVGRLAQRLLGALATAHAAGVVHRDIKPANVLFDDHGEPCLADFGVAYTWDQTSGLTVAGMVVGTPGFMAPEQARDEQLTPASDVFSLGATLLFAATGHGPYGPGDPGLLMVRAAENKVERIPKTVHAGLRRRLRAMLNPRPERRPTAAALLTGDQSALRRPPAPFTGTMPAMAFTAFAAAVVLVALAVGTRTSEDNDRPEDGAPPTGVEDGEATNDETTVTTGSPNQTEVPNADYPPLRDQVEEPLSPAGLAAIYTLPTDGPEGCPDEIALTLQTTSEEGVRMQVVRVAAGGAEQLPLDEVAANDEKSGRLTFPTMGCGGAGYGFLVVVTAEGEPAEQDTYRITREDS
jgi:serine/threonine protein kinase